MGKGELHFGVFGFTFSSWLYTAVSLAHVLASLCHQQGLEPPWCPGVGAPWTQLCFINKPKELQALADGWGQGVCVF